MLFLSFFLSISLSCAPGLFGPPGGGDGTPPLPKPRREFGLPVGAATVAAGSLDGRLLLVAAPNRPITIFQVRTGLALREYVIHQRPVTDAVFSPRRDTVVSADESGEVNLWNAETRTTLGSWRAPGAPVAVRVTPDGHTALIVLGTGAVWRWDLRHPTTDAVALPRPVPALPATSRVTAVRLSPAGTRLILGLASGAVVALDLATGATQTESVFKQPVTALALMGADSVLAVAGTAEMAVWRPDQPAGSGGRLTRIPLARPAATLAADPAGARLAVGYTTGETELLFLPARPGARLAAAPGSPRQLWFEPLDDLLLALGADGRVRSWKLPRVD